MPNRRSHCGTITAVTSIWVTMYRRNRLCRYRSTTNKGTESDCGESPSLHSRGAVLVTVSAVGDSDSAMEAQEDARGIDVCRSSDMLAERAWLGVFFEGLGVGERVLSGDISAGDISARFFCVSTRTVPSNSMRAAGRLDGEVCVAAGIPPDPVTGVAGATPTPRAQSTPTPSACAGSAAVAASASTASALERSPGRRAAEAYARSAGGGLCFSGTSGFIRATHTPTPLALARLAISARSAFWSPAAAPAASRRGTTGESSSASVVSPGTRPASTASRSACADAAARATSRGSAAMRRTACAAAVARYGGRDAEKTYPLPISLWYATTPVSPAQKPPTEAPAFSSDAAMTSTRPASTPKCSVTPRPVPPIAPNEELSSRINRAWCVSFKSSNAGTGATRPVPAKHPSVMSHRRRPGRASRAEVTPSSASRLAKTLAQSSASQWLYQRTSILERRKPAKTPWPTPRSTTATSDLCASAGITEDTVHAPKEYRTASWTPRNSAMDFSTSMCGGNVP